MDFPLRFLTLIAVLVHTSVTQTPVTTSTTPIPTEVNEFCEPAGQSGPGVRCNTTGLCIPLAAICDNHDNCGDGEDELQCPESEDCVNRKNLADQIVEVCPLDRRVLEGQPDNNLNDTWIFEQPEFDSNKTEYIVEVTLNMSQLYITEPALFQLIISSDLSSNSIIRVLLTNSSSLIQTRPLAAPLYFDPSVTASLQLLKIDQFSPEVLSGALSLTLGSGECESATLSCLHLVGEAVAWMEDSSCSGNLGDAIYVDLYLPVEICQLLPECSAGESPCRSGICVPNTVFCDGYDDCGDLSDEVDVTCQPECQLSPTLSSEFSFCYNPLQFPINQDHPTADLKYTMDNDTENFYLTDISVNGINFEWTRMNITTPSSSVVIYFQFPIDPPLIVNLKSPISVNPGELITITAEGANYIIIEPWRRTNVTIHQLIGIQLYKSCEESRVCFETLNVNPVQDNCTISNFKKFLLDGYQHCLEAPRITFLSQNASVTPGYPYVVICVAEGYPTPHITWLQDSSLESNPQQFLAVGASIIKIQLSSSETFSRVTCRASQGSLLQEKTVQVSLIDSPQCQTALTDTASVEACMSVINEVFNIGNIISAADGTVLYNIKIPCASLEIDQNRPAVLDLEIEIRSINRDRMERFKRGFGNLLHTNVYERITCNQSKGDARVTVLPPLLILGRTELTVDVRAVNILSQDLGFADYSYDGSGGNNQPDLTMEVGFLECNVSCSLDEFRKVIDMSCPNQLFIPELEEKKPWVRLEAISKCPVNALGEPAITVHPDQMLASPAGGSLHTSCEGDYTASIIWYKKGLNGDNPTSITGNVLSFSDLDARDQGFYFCRAQGGGAYGDSFADSDPVLVLLLDRDTYLLEMRFDNLVYSDEIADPTSTFFSANISVVQEGIASSLLESADIEDITDVIVQRSGGFVVEALVTLAMAATVEEAKNTLVEYLLGSIGNNITIDNQSVSFQSTSFCAAQGLNNTLAGQLTFLKSEISQTAQSVELCPGYTTTGGSPRATRMCTGNFVSPSVWQDPVLNNCFDGEESEEDTDILETLVETLENNPVTADNVTQVSRDVADVTGTVDLDGGDLDHVAELLKIITNVNSSSPEVTSNTVEIVDNVLDLEENAYEESVSVEAPSRILQALENQLTNLHQGGDDVNFTDVRGFVGAIAFTADKEYFSSEMTFGNFFNSDERTIRGNLKESLTDTYRGIDPSLFDDVKASITLPITLLDDIQFDASDSVPVTFLIHRTSNLFTSRDNQTEEVESLIVGATIEGKNIDNLSSPVVTRFHLLPLKGVSDDRRCVFWDFQLAGGYGGWSSEGCELASGPDDESDDPIVECRCNHLTNFAILVDIQGDIDNVVLDVLSIIGCVVSVFALVITIVTFCAIKKLRSKQPQQILINLCFALLGLYLSFLIGINRANLEVVCIMFGALIHYFCLATVAWMCVEAMNMYLLFVKVFNSGVQHFMKKAALVAWGLPLVVVVVSVAVKSVNYRGDYCFPQTGTMTFYIGVVLFIAVMLVFNLVMFVLIIKQITCRPQFKKDDPRKENIKRIQNAISILMLLGLAWLFGFFAIGGAQFIFNLLFLICNSLQGLFIFLLFCVRNQEVQMEWRLIFGQTGGYKVNKSSNTRSTGSSSSKNPKGNQNVNSDENTTEKIQMEPTSSP
ncbi:uncharacterized protein [Apostichopus japonicus]|uniref:uncharacterized protein isoform X2 n=1 Tax=Stichopus japonicus TaxID=307972 RepID=UPI003AB3AC8C